MPTSAKLSYSKVSTVFLQRGAALLIFAVILLALAFASLLASNTSQKRVVTKENDTDKTLLLAKQALLGYAGRHYLLPIDNSNSTHQFEKGILPCPDKGNSDSQNKYGQQALNCGTTNVNSIGYLPWRTLDLPALKDADGECLWYAVSGNFKHYPRNSVYDTDPGPGVWPYPGTPQIVIKDANGNVVQSNVVAVILAPGKPVSHQSHANTRIGDCQGNLDPSNYMEGVNGLMNYFTAGSTVAVNTFVRAAESPDFNDRFVTISLDELRAASGGATSAALTGTNQ